MCQCILVIIVSFATALVNTWLSLAGNNYLVEALQYMITWLNSVITVSNEWQLSTVIETFECKCTMGKWRGREIHDLLIVSHLPLHTMTMTMTTMTITATMPLRPRPVIL